MSATKINQIGGVLIKPDTHERGLYDAVLEDILSAGFEVIFSHEIVLDDDDVVSLYPIPCQKEGARKWLIRYLSGKPITLIALRKLREDIDNSTDYLHQLKGSKDNKTGIRHKYNAIEITDEDRENKTKEYYLYLMYNNIHVFDTVQEFVEFLIRKGINVDQLIPYLEP
jgi:nucleoside diphosphate kinase